MRRGPCGGAPYRRGIASFSLSVDTRTSHASEGRSLLGGPIIPFGRKAGNGTNVPNGALATGSGASRRRPSRPDRARVMPLAALTRTGRWRKADRSRRYADRRAFVLAPPSAAAPRGLAVTGSRAAGRRVPKWTAFGMAARRGTRGWRCDRLVGAARRLRLSPRPVEASRPLADHRPDWPDGQPGGY